MTDGNKESSVAKIPLKLVHQGECQGVVMFPFLFLIAGEKLRGEGFCTKCGEKLNYNWSLHEMMARCPPPPPSTPPPSPELDSNPALSFE